MLSTYGWVLTKDEKLLSTSHNKWGVKINKKIDKEIKKLEVCFLFFVTKKIKKMNKETIKNINE